MRATRILAGAVIFIIAASVYSAAPKKMTVNDVFALVQKNYNSISDYQVEATVNADFNNPKMHITNSQAIIYFKRPDKVKVEAKSGFAMMPETFPGDPVTAIKSAFNATYEGTVKYNGVPAYVLKLKPKTTEHQGAATLFIEQKRGLILGSLMREQGFSIATKWNYGRVDGKYWLPSEIKVAMSGSFPVRSHPGHQTRPEMKSGKGSATVKFTNYRVNKGIPDNIFAKKGTR